MSDSYSFDYDSTTNGLANSQSQVDYSAHHSSSSNLRRSTSSTRTDIKDEDLASPASNQQMLLEKKRKNASAQAAFRARRTTYISNLEETVTSLEAVVRKLQDACRDAHDDIAELRQDNVRMKAVISGFEARERIWKAYAEATAGTPAGIAASHQLSAIPAPSHPSQHLPKTQQSVPKTPASSTGSLHDHTGSGTGYGEDGTVFGDEPYTFSKSEENDVGLMQHSTHALHLYPSSGQSTAVMTSPISYTIDHHESSTSSSSLSGVPLTPASSVDCHLGGLTSMSYSSGGNGLPDTPLFTVDPNMPPPSSSYASTFDLAAYGFSDYSTNGHRNSLPTTLTIEAAPDHMDTSTSYDMSSPIDGKDMDSSRPRTTRRHTYAAFPAPLPASTAPRRPSSSSSKKGSADAGGVSNTLAVIKAQAFGNVRKTRARAKKNPTSGEAAKAALEILEARGAGLGLDIAGGVKRRKRGDLPALD